MLVRGALHAGCRFFAGYPITPATSILVSMLAEMPLHGGVAIEAEDEIASIGFCIGASMAGRKALTATSGPGISLYSENIGLAIAAEIPLVIVNAQRHGPATGSATRARCHTSRASARSPRTHSTSPRWAAISLSGISS